MNFHLVLGFFLLFNLSGCLTVQSPPPSSTAAGKNNIFTQAYPDGLLHFTSTVLTNSAGISGAFSITPTGEVIQSLEPKILPTSLQAGSAFLQPAWSETDRKILFAHVSGEIHPSVIYMMDSDGKNLKITYTAEPHKAIVSPIWSASSKNIYFLLASVSESGPTDVKLCRISAQGTGFAEIASFSYPGAPMILRLTPDEKHAAIVYVEPSVTDGEPTSEYIIHIINLLNGSEQKRVPGIDLAWSPDSNTIAVIKEKSAAIQITDITTGEIKLLNTGSRLPKKIAWKPDGSSLAYLSDSESENDEKYLLQIVSLRDDMVHDVPVKILSNWFSGLFWTR